MKSATPICILGALAASALLYSGVAGADPGDPTNPANPADPAATTDASFLHALDEDKVTYGDPASTISYAKGLCDKLRTGIPATQLISQVKSANPELTQQGADYFVAATMAHYCPDQVPPGHL